MGGAQAICGARARHRDDRPGRRDRRARQPPTSRRRSASSSATVGIDGIAGPSELMVIAGDTRRCRVGGARPLRPGRARRRTACWSRSPSRTAILDAIAERGREARGRAARASRDAPLALVQVPDPERGDRRSPTPSPPSTSSCSTEDADAARRARSRPPAASSSAATARPPSATTSPAPTTCCRPAAPGASRARSGRAPSGAGSRPSRFRRRRPAKLAPHVDCIGPRRGLPASTASRAMIKEQSHEPHSREQPQHRRDPDPALARPRRRRGEASRPASASSTTCSTCSPATGGSASRSRPSGDLETGAHHTVEDVGIVPRPGARRGARRPRRDPPLRLGAGADGRVAGRVRDRHLRAAALRLRRRPARDLDRRLRHRADRGVLPRRRQQRRS